jgi:hypothetical protein
MVQGITIGSLRETHAFCFAAAHEFLLQSSVRLNSRQRQQGTVLQGGSGAHWYRGRLPSWPKCW